MTMVIPRQIVLELAIANAAHDAWLTRWAWMAKVRHDAVGGAQARAEAESSQQLIVGLDRRLILERQARTEMGVSQQWIEHWREELRKTGEVLTNGLHAG